MTVKYLLKASWKHDTYYKFMKIYWKQQRNGGKCKHRAVFLSSQPSSQAERIKREKHNGLYFIKRPVTECCSHLEAIYNKQKPVKLSLQLHQNWIKQSLHDCGR